MGGKYHRRAVVGHIVEFVDENRAARTQALDDETVVHDLMAHVNRRAERFERAFDDLDGAIYAGAKTTRVGEYDFHGSILPRRPNACLKRTGRTEPAALRRR